MKLGVEIDICVPNIFTKNQLNRTPFSYSNYSFSKIVLSEIAAVKLIKPLSNLKLH
jgi:hypothetical protein